MAVVRGMLVDLLTTGDRAGVEAAMEVYFTDLERRLTAAIGAG